MTPLWPVAVSDKPEGSFGGLWCEGEAKRKEGDRSWLAHPLDPHFPVPRLAVPATSFQWVSVLAGVRVGTVRPYCEVTCDSLIRNICLPTHFKKPNYKIHMYQHYPFKNQDAPLTHCHSLVWFEFNCLYANETDINSCSRKNINRCCCWLLCGQIHITPPHWPFWMERQ